MASDRQIALAKIGSLKTTMFNAIAELELRAEEARHAGRDKDSNALSIKATELARKAIVVRRAEDEIRSRTSLAKVIARLDGIAGDARGTLSRLKKAADALNAAASLIRIVTRIATIFT